MAGYDPSDQTAALAKAQEWGDRIPIGVLYRRQAPTFEEQLPALKAGPLVKQEIKPQNLERLIEESL